MKQTTDLPIVPFTDSAPLLRDPDALRARAEADGFLFLKGLLPQEPLLALRWQILEIVARHGWIRAGTDPMDAVADLDAVARDDATIESLRHIGVTASAYKEIQALELFHALPHHPAILRLFETLLGREVFVHPRHIARVLLPVPSFAPTPPHQDYIYIQGTHQFWTLWFPLGDCPVDLGGLSILKGSHREKVLDVAAAQGAGGKEIILCDNPYSWAQGDYACGDVVTFPSHTIHKGLPNRLGDRIRISVDLRYQPADEEVEEKSLLPHFNIATWDELYAGWENEALQYYWRKKQLKMSPWDASLIKAKMRIC